MLKACPHVPELSEKECAGLVDVGTQLVKDPNLEWLGFSLFHLAACYRLETPSIAGNERQYDALWCGLIDICFNNTTWRLGRGEAAAAVIKQLLGVGTSGATGTSTGPKFDGLIVADKNHSDYAGTLELGYLEVSKDAKNKNKKKFEVDCTKMVKGMVCSFLAHPNGPNLRVSILNSENEMRLVVMKRHPAGIFLLYVRDRVFIPRKYHGPAVRKLLQELLLLRWIAQEHKIERTKDDCGFPLPRS